MIKHGIVNGDDSAVHRLPSKILIAVASHIRDEESLVLATHVCQFWRLVLISSPCLWSRHRVTYKNALVLLERSKSVPISVDIGGHEILSEPVEKSLKEAASKLTALRATDGRSLDQILSQPLQILRSLAIISDHKSPSAIAWSNNPLSPPFYAPNLRKFHFEQRYHSPGGISSLEDGLLVLLRSYPLLEVISFCYKDERKTHETFTMTVPLPYLCSFTHQSPDDTISTGLFNRLSLPRTCHVAFTVTDTQMLCRHWIHHFPTLRDPTDVKVVKFALYPGMVRVTFIDCYGASISVNRLPPPNDPSYSSRVIGTLLESLGTAEIIQSVDALHFEHWRPIPSVDCPTLDLTESLRGLNNLKTLVFRQCDLLLFLRSHSPPQDWCPSVKRLDIYLPPRSTLEGKGSDGLKEMHTIAESRKMCGNPFTTITLSPQGAEELSEECRELVEQLRLC